MDNILFYNILVQGFDEMTIDKWRNNPQIHK